MTFRAFPKIGQYRNVIKEVNDVCKYDGLKLPTVEFTGTVKLHGTNAAVGMNAETAEMWVQSRSRIITPGDDNAGFAKEVQEKHLAYRALLTQVSASVGCKADKIYVYGEWCGGNIQKGVALNQLNKMFVVFKVVAVTGEKSEEIDLDVFNNIEAFNDFNIYFINQFLTYAVEVDFNKPGEVQNKFVELTEKVETECPVCAQLGAKGIGEGIVWNGKWNGRDLIFKVKGEKHSASKVKKLASVDPETLNKISDFVEYACTENRLNQGLENVELEMKNIGQFIGWINKDIHDEESDVLKKNGLSMKEVAKELSRKSREFFISKLDEKNGL
jgi:hypothetical protein